MAGRKKKEVVTQKRKNPCHHNFHFLPPSPLLNLRHQEEGDNVRGVGCNFPRLSTFPPPPPPPPSHSPHPFISFKWPFLFSFSLLPRLVIQTATAEATFSQLMAKRAANREERGRERERERETKRKFRPLPRPARFISLPLPPPLSLSIPTYFPPLLLCFPPTIHVPHAQMPLPPPPSLFCGICLRNLHEMPSPRAREGQRPLASDPWGDFGRPLLSPSSSFPF